MLDSVNLNDKTYSELLLEAIAQIPLYSKEWTNYNVSDPGITILQNLTAFQLVQQLTINEISDEIREKLLKLAGYQPREARPAQLMVQAPAEGGDILDREHLLWSGTIPFEAEEEILLQPWGLESVYAGSPEGERDVTRLLDPARDGAAYPFGRRPQAGNTLTCVLSGTPEVGEALYLWLQVAQEELRNPFDEKTELPHFSQVRWQYYTDQGWQDARTEDETAGMLRSGLVKLWLEHGLPQPAEVGAARGCALRCLLESAEYDRVPRLNSLAVHLFPMVQRESRVSCRVCGKERTELKGRLPRLGNLLVYCREEPGSPYREYRQTPVEGAQGRFWTKEETARGVKLHFEGGCEPCGDPDAVRVVCYDNEMIHHRFLGRAEGYDDQVIPIYQAEGILPESLLLTVVTDEGACYFLTPGEEGPDGFCYRLRAGSGQIVIEDPGRGGYALYLSGCAVTQGVRGNLRARATLEQRGGYDGTEVEERYFSPAPGRFGATRESVEELRARFSAGIRRCNVAVRLEDYENLVRSTPGLCIHKVKAVSVGEENLVRIAVKPYTEGRTPKLSQEYLRQIREYLEPYRMLTARFELCQPRYVAVGVQATLSIRGVADHARETVEQLLREVLDHVDGPENFGGWIRFHEVYQKLSDLPFVEAVDVLNLFPDGRDAVLVGSDVRLGDDCLCYAGGIQLTLREHGR